ncbi:MAG: YegS/Rv2252/BmrU family lipid kinase [Microlunatus sp.]|nr:YegS/Rv2252/BmrU family lipid kinase [Microlunatus sp.]MDN5769906.1 YegS/Rv2252/BmrU family lipid kinase [Microlunatus sp.]
MSPDNLARPDIQASRDSIALVVNPSAGKGRSQRLLPQVAGLFRDTGHRLDILLSRHIDEAYAMATEAVTGGVDTLVVMGGDGMVHLGLNVVAAYPGVSNLGLIPAGTGNDLCRGLGLDVKNPVACAQAIAVGSPRPIDVLEVNDVFVGGVVATGFDALVNRRANAMPRPKGSLRYAVAALVEMGSFWPLPYRLVIDGEPRELHAMLVAVGNTAYYGGGMQICPGANPADGVLDLTIVHEASRAKLLRLLPQTFSGRFARDPLVERLQARTVRVERPGLVGYGDGERLAAGPLDIAVRPGLLSVYG